MKLEFIKDIKKDVQNWQNAVEAHGYGVDWVKYIPNDLSIECIKTNDCLINYLKNNYYDTGLIDAYLKKFKKEVDILEIQKDLEFLMNQKFPDEIKIRVFITTFQRCPYNTKEKLFYIQYRAGENLKKSITNIYHELMHFLFHWHYWGKCQRVGLKENQIHDIKESFTALLNPILIKRNLSIDKGYKMHQELRNKILKFWQDNNDFEIVLEKIIKEIIKNKDF